MKAVYLNELGPPENLQVGELPNPVVSGPGHVVVDIVAASINGADAKVRRGAGKGLISAGKLTTFPYILGRDFSGVIASVGDGVSDLSVGENVFGVCDVGQEGTYCEQIAMKAALCAKKPPSATHSEICSLALTGITAITALEECLNVKAGERVLIQGGSGGVGSVAIELAKHLGAQVITTTSTKNLEYVRGLGADVVIDYTKQDVCSEVSECDAVFDTVGGDVATDSFRVLKPGGRAAFIASGKDAPAAPREDLQSLRPNVQRNRQLLERVVELFEQGVIHPPEIQYFNLEQAVEAHRISESRHFRGKLIFQVRPETTSNSTT